MEICLVLLCGLLIASGALSSTADGKHICFQQVYLLVRIYFVARSVSGGMSLVSADLEPQMR